MAFLFQRIIGTLGAYKFIELLSKKFKKWDAYDTGVLDDEGKILVKADMMTEQQKASYTYFHRLVRKLKFLLETIPGGKSKLGKIATAYYLLREELMAEFDISSSSLDEEFYKLLDNPLTEEQINEIKLDIVSKPAITSPDGNLMGSPFFSCDTTTYQSCMHGKRKTGRWQPYLGDSERGKGIINYAKINNKSGIIIQDETTKTFSYLRKPFGPNRWET
jgi:hypothetical protein